MALITCPECGNQISDKAPACIHCGCPVTKTKTCPECGAIANEIDAACKTCGFPFENTTETPRIIEERAIVPNRTGDLLTEKTAVELINYIQFSVAKIINGKSKGVLEDEFNSVINNINPTSLQDPELISAYDILLSTLMELKLNENQREHTIKVLERKKKSAVTNCLNSFGSVFVPGINPLTLLASTAYTGISAVLNYRRAVNDVRIEGEEAFFEMNQNDVEYIDSLRANLFISTAKVFTNRSNSVEGLISENTMKQFADAVNKIYDSKESAKNSLTFLGAAENDLALFPPYWLARAIADYKSGSENGAYAEYLNKFNELNSKNPIFKKNPYCIEAAKLLIESTNEKLASNITDEGLTEQLKENITKSIEMIKDNTQSIQSDLDSMNFDLVQLYEQIGDFDNALQCIKYLEGRQLIPKNSRLKLQCKILQNDVNDYETVSLMEKVFSAVEFDYYKYAWLFDSENADDALIDTGNPNVKFHISEKFINELDIKSVKFSPDGNRNFITADIVKHNTSLDPNGIYGPIYECSNITWNDMAENPFVEIDFGTFKSFYKVSIYEPKDWEYYETIYQFGSLSKITGSLDLLDSEEVVSGFTNYNIKDGAKLGAKIGAGALFGLVGIGVAAVAAAKDIKKAWDAKGKHDLTWLTISLIAVKKSSGEKKYAIDEDGQILLSDLRS
jgi:hypothetical protein